MVTGIVELIDSKSPLGALTGQREAFCRSAAPNVLAALPAVRTPVLREAGDSRDDAVSDDRTGLSCRVLVIDDEPEILQLLRDILELDGYCVSTAQSGRAGLAQLGQDPFDVVLSDLRMPGLDGPGFYRELEKLRPELLGRVAFITGDTLGASARAFLEQTRLPCLEKPFTPEEVRATVRRLACETGD